MARYVEGWNRSQSFLLRECVDDYVDENNPVRVVDAFVDELDLAQLGFGRAVPAETGRPAYHPAMMLKLYVYGYLNRIPSSRRLERDAQRNIELVWLTGRLAPDFKTIADFRRDNGPAIRAACRQFVMLCRNLDLFADALVHRREQVQGCEHARQKLHRSFRQAAYGAGGSVRFPLHGSSGHRRSPRPRRGPRQSRAPERAVPMFVSWATRPMSRHQADLISTTPPEAEPIARDCQDARAAYSTATTPDGPTMLSNFSLTRRRALQTVSMAAVGSLAGLRTGLAAETLNFATWSAAVDQVKAHLASFEKQTGIQVAYTNSPYAQYRETMITKFTGGAPVDVLWVSDSWLPEFADAGWIVPVDPYKQLMAYAPETSDFCVKSMTYKGKQYGLTYYTDYMSFVYDADLLAKAGITAPPATWAEVTEQAKAIKAKGLSDYPVAIGLAQESWLIEYMTAMVYAHGGSFVDDNGKAAESPGTAAALQWLVDAVAVLRHDGTGGRKQSPGGRGGQTDRVVRRQGGWRVSVPKGRDQGSRSRVRRQAVVQRPRHPQGLRRLW